MPFKSEKQRKWMYANDPEMAKKWEKEEAIKGKLRNLIKQEIKSINESDLGLTYKKGKTVKVTHKKSGKELVIIDKPNVKREYEKIGYFAEGKINEGFEKYHLGGLLDSRLKKRLERAIKIWGGKVDAVGNDYIKFRLGSFEVKKFPALLKKLDRNKNVWIGDKRKNNIWDRRRNIDKLGEAQFLRAKQMVFLPDKKMYYDPMNDNLWLMGPYGGPDLDDDPIEPRDRDYKKIIRKLSSKDKSVLKKAMRTRKRRKEATTSVSVPGYLTPNAFSKSTQKAIDTDDEDDEKSESMAAPFRRRKSRGLGRPMKVGLSEGKSKPRTGDYVKTMIGVIAKIEKVRGTIAYMKLQDRKSKGYWINDLKNLKSTDKMEKGKSLWTESIDELQMAPFSSQEARSHINSDIKDMSKHLGRASQQVIKIMMDGVRKGKYTAMDISRGIKEGPAARTHFGEMTFIQSLWTKMRDKFRRYSKDRKLS